MLRKLIFHTLGKFSTHLENFWPHLAWVRSPCPAAYFFHFASICDPEWLLTPSMTCILAGKLKSIQIATHKSALKVIDDVLDHLFHQSNISSMAECSPLTPQARVQFPEGTIFLLIEGKLTVACLLQDKDLNVRTFQWLALQ